MTTLSSRMSNIELYISNNAQHVNTKMANIENFLQDIAAKLERESINFDDFRETPKQPERKLDDSEYDATTFSPNITIAKKQSPQRVSFKRDRPEPVKASPPKALKATRASLPKIEKVSPPRQSTTPKKIQPPAKRITVTQEEIKNYQERRSRSKSLKVLKQVSSSMNKDLDDSLQQKSQIVIKPNDSSINIKKAMTSFAQSALERNYRVPK